jgi:hypothetical protein
MLHAIEAGALPDEIRDEVVCAFRWNSVTSFKLESDFVGDIYVELKN